jgi:hypothetical protein
VLNTNFRSGLWCLASEFLQEPAFRAGIPPATLAVAFSQRARAGFGASASADSLPGRARIPQEGEPPASPRAQPGQRGGRTAPHPCPTKPPAVFRRTLRSAKQTHSLPSPAQAPPRLITVLYHQLANAMATPTCSEPRGDGPGEDAGSGARGRGDHRLSGWDLRALSSGEPQLPGGRHRGRGLRPRPHPPGPAPGFGRQLVREEVFCRQPRPTAPDPHGRPAVLGNEPLTLGLGGRGAQSDLYSSSTLIHLVPLSHRPAFLHAPLHPARATTNALEPSAGIPSHPLPARALSPLPRRGSGGRLGGQARQLPRKEARPCTSGIPPSPSSAARSGAPLTSWVWRAAAARRGRGEAAGFWPGWDMARPLRVQPPRKRSGDC